MLKDGRSRFIPVIHPARMLALVSCTILAALAILRPAIRFVTNTTVPPRRRILERLQPPWG